MEDEQKQYELVCILKPHLEEADLSSFKQDFENLVTENNGQVIHFMEPEKRELAYPINKQNQGIYLVSHIQIGPENIANLSRQLKINNQVLRHLITHLETPRTEIEKPRPIKRPLKPGKSPVFTKAPSTAEPKASLEEIDKKLDELVGL